ASAFGGRIPHLALERPGRPACAEDGDAGRGGSRRRALRRGERRGEAARRRACGPGPSRRRSRRTQPGTKSRARTRAAGRPAARGAARAAQAQADEAVAGVGRTPAGREAPPLACQAPACGHGRVSELTWRQVIARRLARSHLLDPAPRTRVVDVVRDVDLIQAQVLSAAEIGLCLRVRGITAADVRRELYQRRSLVKTWSLRGTLHLVPADE